MRLTCWRLRVPLTAPYKLAFTTLDALDCFYLRIEGEGRVGYGEITPLPGYGNETGDLVAGEIVQGSAALAEGVAPDSLIASIARRAPMTASGIACAFETWQEGGQSAFTAGVDTEIPLAALCPGDAPDEAAAAARRLVAQGYATLKLKVGAAPLTNDLARIESVAGAVRNGAVLRLDANQALDPGGARELCQAAEALPVALVEQPFAPASWEQFESLAGATNLPLMLDESIWSEEDVKRAGATGARLIKLKLCKHRGLAHTRRLARMALEEGLGVVFGNGVQSALGNHLEARLFADLDLSEAAEINGFLKVADSPVRHRLRVSNGRLHDEGLHELEADLADREPFHVQAFGL